MKDIFDSSLPGVFGLNALEARMYQLLLRSGPQSASSIAKIAGTTRTNTYNVLAALSSKDLVERRGTGYKTSFVALNPRRLTGLLERQEQEIRRSRLELEETLKTLVVDHSLAEGAEGVFRFEGKPGMIRVYEELLRDKAPVNSIMDRKLLRSVLADYNPEWVKKRIRRKIRSRIISPHSDVFKTDNQQELREIRYLDPKDFPFGMDLKVTSKKVVMTTFKEESIGGIIIVNPEVIRNFSILFEFLWRIAKPESPASSLGR